MAEIFNFPDHQRRKRMADSLLAAYRCADAAQGAQDPFTARALERASRRYVDQFNALACGRDR